MDALKDSMPRTYRTVVHHLDLYQPIGELDIDLNDARLGSYTCGELIGFAAAQKAKQPEPVAPPPAPEPPKPAEPEDDSELRERAVDEAEGLARVEYYVGLGLIDTPGNGGLLLNFVNKSAKSR